MLLEFVLYMIYGLVGLVVLIKLLTAKITYSQITNPAAEFERIALKHRLFFSKKITDRVYFFFFKKIIYLSYYLDILIAVSASASLAYLIFTVMEKNVDDGIYLISLILVSFSLTLAIFGFMLRNELLVIKNFTVFSKNLDVLIPFFQNFFDEKPYFIKKMGVMNIYYAEEVYRVLSRWLQGSILDKVYDKHLSNPLYPSEAEALLRILNISPAKKHSFNDIKRTYRELVKKYHPDVTRSDPDSIRKFKEISRAYSILVSKYSYIFDD
jgi:hypothetical protein